MQQLIHHSECLGPALTGDPLGLFRVYEEALQKMSSSNGENGTHYGGQETFGSSMKRASISPQLPDNSILMFYTSLVRLLACCASRFSGDFTCTAQSVAAAPPPSPAKSYSANRHKQSMISRTRNILQNLIKVEDVIAILSVRSLDGREIGLTPFHKDAVLLFFDRVYGVPDQDQLVQLLTEAFLPDVNLALYLTQVSESYSI